MDQRTDTPDLGGPRHRLPNLYEVLSRRTLAPVDLYSFYIYMRDVQRSVDYLDFWLDVSQHMSLCRHYVRELRRSVLMDTPELEKGGSKRSSQTPDGIERPPTEQGPSLTKERNGEKRLSAFLRGDNGSKHSPHNSLGSHRGSDQSNSNQQTPGAEHPPRPSFMTSDSTSPSPGVNGDGSPGHTVARGDIRQSAEKILYTYLLPGAEREIILPQAILNDITNSVEKDGRDDPEVFDHAKDYVFQAMERDAFPDFLRAKALGNLVSPSMLLRLIIGLVALFGGLWTAFCLIFLDYGRSTRAWVVLPFTLAVYFLGSHQYMLDPLLALAGYSEYTFLHFARIREPYVRKLINKRAIMELVWMIGIDAALCCLFIFVPGKRL